MRARRSPVTFTQAALSQVETLMESAPEGTMGLRFGLKQKGCAGMAYRLDYTAETSPTDEKVMAGAHTIFIDPSALLFLLGTEIDYVDDLMSAGFVFNNPNQVGTCGCGESVKLEACTEPKSAS